MYKIYTKSTCFPKNNTKKRYKVILNAGGGCFGYVITYLMASLDFDLYSKIDVVAGTSIGGILSLIYSINRDYIQINRKFKEYSRKIFTPKIFSTFRCPSYQNNNLQMFLNQFFEQKTLKDIPENLKIIVPTLDMTLKSPRIFTNIITAGQEYMLNIPMTKIGLMTSAAPTYFLQQKYKWNQDLLQSLRNENEYQYQQKNMLAYQALKRLKLYPDAEYQSAIADGGIIQNIPVFSMYTTLKSKLGINLQDIDVLIIGTGDDVTPDREMITQNINSWNLFDWLKFIKQYITQSNQITSINFGAQLGFHSFRCWNNIDVIGSMDNPQVIPDLQKKCAQKREQFKQTVQEFLNQP